MTAATAATTSPTGPIEVPVTSGTRKGETLTLRQVTRRDKGRQVHILTTIGASQLPAAGVAYRMTGRWREENWFRYGRAHFALDSLDSYAVTPDDPTRLVPNPAKKTAAAAVKAAQKTLADAEAARQRKLGELRSPAPGSQTVITNAMLARLDVPVDAARRSLQAAQAASQSDPGEDPAPRAQPEPGPARNPDQADHPRDQDGRVQHRDQPRPRPERQLRAAPATRHTPSSAKPCTPAATSSPATAPSPSASASYQRRAAPELWPRSAPSSTPPRPATPAPSLSCATKSAPRPALHKRSPMSGVLSPDCAINVDQSI